MQDCGDDERAEPHRDRGLRAPLEVADGDGARHRAQGRPGEDDEIGARDHERVGHERDRHAHEHRRAGQALALPLVLHQRAAGAHGSSRRQEEAPEGERQERAPGGHRVPDGRNVEVEGRVLRRRVAQRTYPHVEILALGSDRPHGHDDDHGTRDHGRSAHRIPHGVSAAGRRGHPGRTPREADPEQRDAQPEQAAAALEPDEHTDGRHDQPRRALAQAGGSHGRPRPLRGCRSKARHREATEGHRQARHRADVAQHRARLDEVERASSRGRPPRTSPSAGRRGARRRRTSPGRRGAPRARAAAGRPTRAGRRA